MARIRLSENRPICFIKASRRKSLTRFYCRQKAGSDQGFGLGLPIAKPQKLCNFSQQLLRRGYNARMKKAFPPPLKSRSNPFSWLVLPAVFLLGLGTGWLIWGFSATPTAAAPVADSQVNINQDVKRYEVTTDGDPELGPDNAPVTIIEFSDYQCPYCAKWHAEVFERLMKTYEGKIRFVYRDFPLYSIHPQAQAAAEAANCAGEQGAYWKYYTALFSEKYSLGGDAYTQYAKDLGLDAEKLNQCLSAHRYQAEVDADFKYASNLGVSSTPTFFINGLAVVGAQPYEVFQQIIDKELAGGIPK
jgi:protein-disulfide isomerase